MGRISISRPSFLLSYRTESRSLSPPSLALLSVARSSVWGLSSLRCPWNVQAWGWQLKTSHVKGVSSFQLFFLNAWRWCFSSSIPQTLGIYAFMEQIRILSEWKERLSATIPEQCVDRGYPEQALKRCGFTQNPFKTQSLAQAPWVAFPWMTLIISWFHYSIVQCRLSPSRCSASGWSLHTSCRPMRFAALPQGLMGEVARQEHPGQW